jgi:DeoR/GlpR family transcriptional regulator of sugar metabolism
MTEQAAARRMRILEGLRFEPAGKDLSAYAGEFAVDERTVRRDVDYLQDVVGAVSSVGLRRGRVYATQDGHGPGYFGDQVGHNQAAKQGIARSVVQALGDNQAIALTAGSTTFYVAREIRRAHVEEDRPRNLIAFTNSLPALLELIAAGVSTGVIGEVYNPDDCAFHSHEFHSAFQPSVAVVGASGVVANLGSGSLELFSHRAEEASFLKQFLGPIPEIFVAVDSSKLGRRHPWSFTSGGVLTGKRVRLFTDRLEDAQRETLQNLTETAVRTGCAFTYHETGPAAPGSN